MKPARIKLLSALTGLCLTLASGAPALADDSEIYLGALADSSVVRPNILLLIDTSGSMGSTVYSKDPYDPAVTYPDQGCGSGSRVYFRLGSGTPPGCGSSYWFYASSNKCKASFLSLQSGAGGGPGTWTGKAAQWNASWGARRWDNLRTSGAASYPVECEVDAGNHGATDGSSLVYARDGDNNNRWTSDSAQRINWASRNVYQLYSANWLNYYWWPGSSSGMTRIQTVRQVAKNLINSVDNVNLGLMRFSSNSQGGMVIHEMADVATARASLDATINTTMLPADSNTPLAESLYEATKYWLGANVDFGLTSQRTAGVLYPSIDASRQGPAHPELYKSPIEYQCQKNFTIVLTDGEPVGDYDVPSGGARLTSLPDFTTLVGPACRAPQSPGGTVGECFDDIADYLFKADLNPDLSGRQNSVVHTVGFAIPGSAVSFLTSAATKGGGQFYDTSNAADLTVALQNIITDILQTNVTFTSPTISVNAFNRAETLDHLYVSVFRPDERFRWRGNLKKYRLEGGVIKDVNGADAVDPSTGFFADGVQSFWSPEPDGRSADYGGAASQLPAPASRNVYTHLAAAGTNLTAAGNRLDKSNASITDAMIGLAGAADDPTRDQLLDWARGQDVADEDGDGDSAEARLAMGDPIHSRPALVAYGGTSASPDAYDAVAFVPTNEGFVHAVDTVTGQELWAFIPEEMLPRLRTLYVNPPSVTKDYGVDGDVRVLKFDVNEDGIVDAAAGDRVYLYFGLRRGGRYYYALDVTHRDAPRLLWKKSDADLPQLGFAWSTPTIARVKIAGAAQNGENLVLIVGGGYDDVQENYDYAADASGNRIYMLDAATGALLWHAGGSGSGADLQLASLTNSIPGDVTVLDTDGDRYADRMYAADMGGHVFRFDIRSGNARGSLVTGGAIATLGAAEVGGAGIEDTRRFYNAPDVALIKRRGKAPYYNLAIGSGYRGHPLHAGTHDRFYSIRDRNPFGKLTQAQYDALTPILDGDLYDVTDDANATIPEHAPGWKLELRLNGGWVGEKVLAESVTVNNVIMFPTFEPTPPGGANPCTPASGRNRLYALRVDNGGAAVDFNDDGEVDDGSNGTDERFTDLAQSGIAAELAVVVDHDAEADPNPNDPASATPTVCISGVEVLNQCVSIGGVGRTFWQRNSQ